MVLLHKPTKWSQIQKEVAGKNFIEQLQKFDHNNVTNKVYQRVFEYLQRPNFNEAYIKKNSETAGNICAWIVATVNYIKFSKDDEDKV